MLISIEPCRLIRLGFDDVSVLKSGCKLGPKTCVEIVGTKPSFKS
jgi:hypothetical protein